MSNPRLCRRCGNEIHDRRRSKALYCTDRCYKATERERQRSIQPHRNIGLASGTVGACSELEACVDLMKKGYEVFRAVSPSSSCDLMVLRGNRAFRIEVRTGYYLPSGKLVRGGQPVRADILATVTQLGVGYEPELPLDGSRSIDAMESMVAIKREIDAAKVEA
jgi:hypothetical protein